MIVTAISSAGSKITGSVRNKLTNNGKLLIEFNKRPKKIKGLKIEVKQKVYGKTLVFDLTIQDVEAKFPSSNMTHRIVE